MAQGIFMRTSVSKRAGRPFPLGSTSKPERFLMRLPWVCGSSQSRRVSGPVPKHVAGLFRLNPTNEFYHKEHKEHKERRTHSDMLGDVIHPAGEARIRVVRLQISFFVTFVIFVVK